MIQPSFRSAGQRGMTLLVALIVLVMVTLLAVSAFRASNTNLKVVGSMQGRQQGIAAAQDIIDQVLSTSFFTQQPATVGNAYYGVDINGDGTDDYVVSLANPIPKCVRAQPVVIGATLKPEDQACVGSARLGSSFISSYCSDTIWEINATTTDKLTAATSTVRQGVAVRVAITDATTSCK